MYINSTWHCVCVPAYLCVCYRFNVTLTERPDPTALHLFKPFKEDVFRIEDGRPVLKYQHVWASAVP